MYNVVSLLHDLYIKIQYLFWHPFWTFKDIFSNSFIVWQVLLFFKGYSYYHPCFFLPSLICCTSSCQLFFQEFCILIFYKLKVCLTADWTFLWCHFPFTAEEEDEEEEDKVLSTDSIQAASILLRKHSITYATDMPHVLLSYTKKVERVSVAGHSGPKA